MELKHEQQREQQQEEVPTDKRQRLIFQVDEGHRSKQTAKKYRTNFRYFLDYVKIRDLEVLLDLGREAIQELVIKYTISLRDNPEKKYSRGTVNNRIAPILYFLENNDIELNKRKIKRYFPPDESTNGDRPYSVEEIQRMLSVCDLRTKAIILLMVSSGVRVGALHTMQIGDLTKLGSRSLYKIQVYARTKDKYYTFTTPEATKFIDDYLDDRRRCHEELKPEAPLFRKHFNRDDQLRINLPEFMTETAVIKSIVDGALKKSGVYKTSEVMRTHAFRKHFMTVCEQSGMKSINVKMLLGHDIGVSGHYYRPAESDILSDYMTHAADALTIDPNQRLQKKVQELESEQAEEIAILKKKMDYVDSMMNALKGAVSAKSQASHTAMKEALGWK